MATDTKLVQGEVVEDPDSQESDVEKLLIGLLQALLREQPSYKKGKDVTS
jgi:hypothetical protein